MEGKVLKYAQAAQRFAQQEGIQIPGLGSNNGEAQGGHGDLVNGLDLKTAGKAAQQFAQKRGIQIPGLGPNNGEAQGGHARGLYLKAAGKAAQQFAQKRGIQTPGLGSNNGEAQEGHSGFDINAAGAAVADMAGSAAANVAKTFGFSSDSTNEASRGGANKRASGMSALGGDDPGAGESSELQNKAPQRPIPQRSQSFSGTSNVGAFGQHHGGGFYPAVGFASQPGTPHFPGQVAPGFQSPINNWGQPQGFFPPGFGQGFSGGIAAQGHSAFAPQPQAWQPWDQHTQPVGLGFSNGFENPIASNLGFTAGSSGSQSVSDSENFWPAAGLAAGGGLAGAGLASAYNQGYVGSDGYGYDMMQPGPDNPLAQNGEPKTEVWGFPIPDKGGGGDSEKREGKREDEVKEGPTTEQPLQGGGPDGNWLNVPTSYEVPDCTPKGLEILAIVDELTVQQEVEALEAAANAFGIGYEGNNLYKISTSDGVQVFRAEEDTGFFWRCCCTQLRPVHIKVINQAGDQVLAFQRHFRCFPCAWFEPCREHVKVFYGPKEDNKVIGRVTQSCCGGCCTPTFNVEGVDKRELLVQGPCIIADIFGARFDLLTENNMKVGEMKKLALNDLNDILKEVGTDADTFTITFPQDLKVETKATALVALFLVDLIFFEFGGGANRNLDETWTFDCCVIFFCGCPLHCRLNMNRLFDNKNEDKGKGAPVANQIER